MGLDQPLWKQFWDYLWQLLHGDFGVSLVTHEPVPREFLTLFPATLELTLAAMLFAIVLGIPAGVIAGLKRGSCFDHTLTAAAVTGNSMPIFWWGLLLILFFSATLGRTPVSGRIDLLYDFQPVTGFMLIDSLLSGEEGAFRSALSPSHPADDRARHHPARGDHAHHPLGDARGPERGLCPHRPRQGPVARAGRRPPRPAQRPDPGDHGHRPAGRRR